MIIPSFYAAIATFCFCVLFNITGKKMFVASFGGGLGWFIYLLLQHLNASTSTSLFFASIALGIFSEIMARLLKTPVTSFVVPALIPLVPGGGMYYTMLETVQGNINSSLEIGLETISNAGALAVGLVFVSSITLIINHLKSRKERKGTP
jgi:uncharacterized membrane protein YjjB (DUF3815 family)